MNYYCSRLDYVYEKWNFEILKYSKVLGEVDFLTFENKMSNSSNKDKIIPPFCVKQKSFIRGMKGENPLEKA